MSQGAVEWGAVEWGAVEWGAVQGGAVEWVLAACGVLLLPKVPFQDLEGLLTNQVTAFMGPVCSCPSHFVPMATSWVLSLFSFYRRGKGRVMAV